MITITLAGQDITSTVDITTLEIDSDLGMSSGYNLSNTQRSTQATFTCKLGPVATAYGAANIPKTGGPYLASNGEVVVTDNGTLIFDGFVDTCEDKTDKLVVKTKITCHDAWQELGFTLVNNVYSNVYDVDILNDLVANWVPWITLDPTTIGCGTLIYKKVYRGKSVIDIIQDMCKISGYTAWVDFNKVLHYKNPNQLPQAPIALSDVPDNINTFAHSVTKYSLDTTSIVNRVLFLGGKELSSDYTQDLSPQANGSNLLFVLAYYPHVASDGYVHVEVGGVAKVVGTANANNTLPKNMFKSKGGLADVLVSADSQTILFDTGEAPSNNGPNSVTATYRYTYPLAIEVTSQPSYLMYGKYYDGKIVDQSVFTITEANARAQTVLTQQAFGLPTLELITYTPGIVAGQVVNVTNQVHGINASFRALTTKTTAYSKDVLWYDITLGAPKPDANTAIMAALQLAAPQDTTTDESTTVIQFYEHYGNLVVTSPPQMQALAPHQSGAYYSGNAYSGFLTLLAMQIHHNAVFTITTTREPDVIHTTGDYYAGYCYAGFTTI